MSKPSDRKRRKRKAHERADARRKHLAEQRRIYQEKFPGFVFQTNGAPPEFVKLVQRAIKKINFRNPRLFSTAETKFFRLAKEHGPEVIHDFLRQTEDDPATQLGLLGKLGHRVFSTIPRDELLRWIPYHDVQIVPRGAKILVSFRSLLTAKGPGGTIYCSRHKPTLAVDGENKIVAFSQHAIQRVCERIVPHWDTYAGLGNAFALFDQYIHFEQATLHDGQLAFTFYDQCQKGFFSWNLVDEILGEGVEDDGHYYYRVGYCPAVVEGNFIKATTLLFPGHRNTPEHRFVWASDVPVAVKRKVEGMDAAWLQATGDFGLVKCFHQRGVHQVIHDEREFFKPSM